MVDGVEYDFTSAVDALPSGVLSEFKTVIHNAKPTPNGDIKFKAKTHNVSNPKTNVLDVGHFTKYLWANHSKQLRKYEYVDYLDDAKGVLGIIEHMFGDNKTGVDQKSLAASTHLNWSSASGSKIEQARSQQYWKINKKDVEFLKYIKVAYAGEGHEGKLIVYVRCQMNTNTYVQVDPLSNIRPSSVISILSSIVGGDGKTNLFDELEREYVDYVESVFRKNKHKFSGCILGALSLEDQEGNIEYCAYTFQDFIKEVIKNHLNDMALRMPKEPEIISSNPETAAFYHFDKTKIVKGDWSHWRDWMYVIPPICHDVFKAYIYSIFVPRNKGRQALWLHGEGYDGKTQVTIALSRYMKGCGVGSMNSKVAASQFAFGAAYGKRLLIFGDCQNRRFLSTSVCHSILGGDAAPVEKKNKDVFTSRIFCKMFIGSNVHPELDANATHETSRVIYIPLQLPSDEIQAKFLHTDEDGRIIYDSHNNPIPIGYKGEKGKELNDYLFEEMDAFLFECRDAYMRLCPNNKEIIVEEDVKDFLYNVCSSEPSEQYEKYIQANYDFSQEIESCELVSDIKDRAVEHFNDPQIMRRFKNFKLSDFNDAFVKNAKRELRKVGTPVKEYRVMRQRIDEKREQVYLHVRYKGEDNSTMNLD